MNLHPRNTPVALKEISAPHKKGRVACCTKRPISTKNYTNIHNINTKYIPKSH